MACSFWSGYFNVPTANGKRHSCAITVRKHPKTYCATVGAIESANIVGYQDISKGAVAKPMFGFTFVPTDGSTSVKLGSVTVTGMRGGLDYLQVINPTTLGADAQYTYYSAAQAAADAADSAEELVEEGEYDDYDEAYADEFATYSARVGWWNGAPGGKSSARSDNVIVNPGDAFLVYGNASRPHTFNIKGVLDLTPIE